MSQELSLEQALGQLLIIGFDGHVAPDFALDAIAQGQVSGAILFRRNVDADDIAQVCRLTASLHAAGASAPATPLVCVDQEGGRVVRLRAPLSPVPPMRQLGARGDTRLVAAISEVVAAELQALGFNLNFAPVLDVDTNPHNPVIGDRAFSDDPETVARMGGAWALGHMMGGVIPCGKHFPGHGDTAQDSHLTLPTLLHDRARLDRVELLPFARAARAKLPMLMTAHVVVAALDPIYPATLSEAVIQHTLRDKLGFEGVVVSDCLEMKAVADHHTIESMVERGLRAGVDLFLICHTRDKWERARAHALRVAAQDPALAARIHQSAQRVMALKRDQLGSWPRPWTPSPSWRDVLGAAEHVATLARVGEVVGGGVDPTEAS